MTDSFAGNDQVPAAGQDASGTDQSANIDGLTPEQVQAVLKRDQHAQEHIRRLEAEAAERKQREQEIADRLAQLESELSKRAALEELLARKAGGDNTDKSGDQTKALDVDSVVSRVLQSMEQKTAAERAKANRVAAIEAARSVYGESYKQKVEDTAKDLGMTLKDVDDLAARSPKAFAKMFGLQSAADATRRDTGAAPGVNSQAVASANSGKALTDSELAVLARENRKALFGKDAFEKIAQANKQR